jgi:hypothetical protein
MVRLATQQAPGSRWREKEQHMNALNTNDQQHRPFYRASPWLRGPPGDGAARFRVGSGPLTTNLVNLRR